MVELNDLRKLAAGVAASYDLREVRLFNVDGSLDHFPPNDGGLTYNYEANIEVQQVPETDSMIIDGKYRLVVHFMPPPMSDDADGAEAPSTSDDDDEDAGHEHLAHLYFQLAALYVQEGGSSKPAFPDNELDAFAQTTGMLALHPYAREFISSMTGRMGLPALHLQSARIPLDKLNDSTDTPAS